MDQKLVHQNTSHVTNESYRHDESDRLRHTAKTMLLVCLEAFDKIAFTDPSSALLADDYSTGIIDILETVKETLGESHRINLFEIKGD